MKKKVRFFVALFLTLVLAAVGLTPATALADDKGTTIFGNTTDNGAFYERVVNLNDGNLLATFMRKFPLNTNWDGMESFLFYKSSDNGLTWTQVSELNASDFGFNVAKQGMEALYVLPQQVGAYPAGTILFASTDWDSSDAYGIHVWRSTDYGASWQLQGQLAPRGTNDPTVKSNNVWEPEFSVDSYGRLVCYFSDERQQNYDQCIAEEISNDGGVTWGGYTIVVGQSGTTWRPGMPRVTRLENGTYFMAYENINSTPNGGIRFRTSTDGINWGDPTNPGTLISAGNATATQCPEIAFIEDGSTYGRLFVRGMNDTNISASELFTSTDNGQTWSIMDAPLTLVRNESVGSSWSGTLLPIDNKYLVELNNYYNGSYNEIHCGIGVVYKDGIIISGAYYKLTNENSGMCLDDAGGSTTPGNKMIQWPANGLDTQTWRVDYMGNDYFKLTDKYSNLCLDDSGSSTTAGTQIEQWTDNGADAQRWKIDDMGGGFYRLTVKASNLVLDVDGGSTQEHANIIQNVDTGSSSQRWNLQRVYTVARFQSYNFPDDYIRHNDGRLKIDNNFTTLPIEDSYWQIVPALNGDPTCVSLESSEFPGCYVRHRNGEVWLDQNDGTTQFQADASWHMEQGLADGNDVSFETSNFPDEYMRHENGLFYITTISSDLDKADATFKEFLQ